MREIKSNIILLIERGRTLTTVYIDADGCPVIPLAIDVANQFGFKVILVCDTSHHFEKQGAKTITLSQGPDAVDFYIVNHVNKDDIVITQDYGLAAMVLAREAYAINQNGVLYTNENISGLLEMRHLSQKIRRSGRHLKGPRKRKEDQNRIFYQRFMELCREVKSKSK